MTHGGEPGEQLLGSQGTHSLGLGLLHFICKRKLTGGRFGCQGSSACRSLFRDISWKQSSNRAQRVWLFVRRVIDGGRYGDGIQHSRGGRGARGDREPAAGTLRGWQAHAGRAERTPGRDVRRQDARRAQCRPARSATDAAAGNARPAWQFALVRLVAAVRAAGPDVRVVLAVPGPRRGFPVRAGRQADRHRAAAGGAGVPPQAVRPGPWPRSWPWPWWPLRSPSLVFLRYSGHMYLSETAGN